MGNITAITKTYAKRGLNGNVKMDPDGECPALHVAFDSGEEELHVVDSIVITPFERRVSNSVIEYFKRSVDEEFFPIPSRRSQIYVNNMILISDLSYCLISGETAGVAVPKSEAITIAGDGSIVINDGYSTLYEFYKQTLGTDYIFSPIRNFLYDRNTSRLVEGQ